jgi:hypothetical protein
MIHPMGLASLQDDTLAALLLCLGWLEGGEDGLVKYVLQTLLRQRRALDVLDGLCALMPSGKVTRQRTYAGKEPVEGSLAGSANKQRMAAIRHCGNKEE